MTSLLVALLLSGGFTPGAGGGYDTVQDEGTPLAKRTTINFTGAGVTCSDSGGITVCNATGGGGGAGNWTTATVTVTRGLGKATVAAAWVSATSHPICTPVLDPGTSLVGPDVVQMARFSVAAGVRVAGVSFDVRVSSPTGVSGSFKFYCTGD